MAGGIYIYMENIGLPINCCTLSLAYIDGSTNKTDRAKVSLLIDNMVDTGNMYRQQYMCNGSGFIVSATYPPESPKYMQMKNPDYNFYTIWNGSMCGSCI